MVLSMIVGLVTLVGCLWYCSCSVLISACHATLPVPALMACEPGVADALRLTQHFAW
jgi:hypothetical protein